MRPLKKGLKRQAKGPMRRYLLFSFCYRLIRKWVIKTTFAQQQKFQKKKDLECAIEKGDKALNSIMKVGGKYLFYFHVPKGFSSNLFDIHFDSPLTFAAFKDQVPMLDMWCRLGAGGGLYKTILPKKSHGNQRPRIVEVEDGFINALGLPGKGVKRFVEQSSTAALFKLKKPIGLSIGGHSSEDYLKSIRLLDQTYKQSIYGPAFYELNLSCPNTPDGQDLLKNLNLIECLINDIRQFSSCILGLKVSPDQDNEALLKIAEIARTFNGVYINAGNTTYQKNAQISIGGGGLSGASLFPRTLEMISLLKDSKVPLIATGGVDSAAKVEMLLESGASLVGMASILVKDPFVIPKIHHKLSLNKS